MVHMTSTMVIDDNDNTTIGIQGFTIPDDSNAAALIHPLSQTTVVPAENRLSSGWLTVATGVSPK